MAQSKKTRKSTKVAKKPLKCQFCSGQLVETLTTFPVVLAHVVYVVEKVPTLECDRCGTTVFTQKVTERLDVLTSGPIQKGMKRRTAYIYQFRGKIVDQANVQSPNGTVIPYTAVARASTEAVRVS